MSILTMDIQDIPLLVFECIFIIAACLLPICVVYSYWIYTILLLVMYISYRIIIRKGRILLDVNGKGVVITGCDTGSGHHLAKRLAANGFTVYAGVLHPDGEGATVLKSIKSSRLNVISLDVTSDHSVKQAAEKIKSLIHKQDTCVWGVVNNAGFTIHGDIEHATIEQFKKCAEVNLYGMIRVIKAFLPMIRTSKGRVVNISSVKGRYPWPNHAVYHVTKYGVETLTDCLRLEMTQFGVKVSVVEPGKYDKATSFSKPFQKERLKAEIDVQWKEAAQEVRQFYGKQYFYKPVEKDLEGLSSTTPNPVLNAIEDALINTIPKPRYLVPGGDGVIDECAEYARFYNFVPTWVSDFILLRATGYNKKHIPTSVKQE